MWRRFYVLLLPRRHMEKSNGTDNATPREGVFTIANVAIDSDQEGEGDEDGDEEELIKKEHPRVLLHKALRQRRVLHPLHLRPMRSNS